MDDKTRVVIEHAVADNLRKVEGVDAAFSSLGEANREPVIYIVVEQHSAVDMAELIEIEDDTIERFGVQLEFKVRAHQGRRIEALFPNMRRLV